MRLWLGERLNAWRMWGVTIKTSNRWWFIGVSVEVKE